MSKVCGGPVQPPSVGVTVTVADCGDGALAGTKPILPEPEGSSPMSGLGFVQV